MKPERLTAVVDIGAGIDRNGYVAPYKAMLDAGLCTVVGFEPEWAARGWLIEAAGPNEIYLPDIVADGRVHTMYATRARGMTSLLKPDKDALSLFKELPEMGAVIAEVPNQRTITLDDIAEATPCDFLKMDVQGSEMMVLEWGGRTLRETVAIQLEVSFLPLYRNQPPFGAVDTKLRSMGFLPHKFMEGKSWPLVDDPEDRGGQLLEADVLYVRKFRHKTDLSQEQWSHLALLSEHVFKSPSLTKRCLNMIDK